MIIDNILIGRSTVSGAGKFIMHIELNGYKYSGYFSDMGGFLTAVSDAAKFFMVKMGKLSNAQARASREIQDVVH